MTISTTDRTAGPYAGDGVSTQFPFAFKVFQARDLAVYLTPSGSAPVLLTLDVDYRITLSTNQDSNPGGTVILVAPLAAGNTLTIGSAIAALQPTALTNQGGFYPKVIENALDRLTIIFQQLGFQNIASGLYSLKQVLRYQELDGGGPLPLLADRRNKILGFDDNGNPTSVMPTSDSAQGVRVDLAKPSGASMVGYGGSTVKDALDTIGKNFDLSWLITKDGNKVVITGDSLSFNVYDFAGGSPTNEAESCLPGLMSWSFMLRDFIHRADPWFVHADMIDFIGCDSSLWSQATPYVAPFNNRYVSINGDASTVVSCLLYSRNKQTGKLILHCMNNPNGDDGLVDVYYSLHPYTNKTPAGTIATGGRTKYQGFEPFQFEIGCGATSNYPVQIEFRNFRNNDGTAPNTNRRMFLQAVGTKNTLVKLTGHGGWKASDVYADFNNRIGRYAPDLLVMILGANDRYYTTKENYAVNLVNIIKATKALKPYCKIVVLTALRGSDPGYGPDEVLNGSTMSDFIDYAKAAALKAGAIWFDTYDLTSGWDPAIWRYDNVHMTKRGNKMMFDSVIGRYFSAAPGDMQYYDPLLQANEPRTFKDGLPPVHGNFSITFSNASKSYAVSGGSDQDIAVKSVTYVNSYTVRFRFNYNIMAQFAHTPRLAIPTLTHKGSSSYFIQPRIGDFGIDSVDFLLFESIGKTLVTDTQNDGQTYVLSF